MPTYEYACGSCRRHTEAVQRFSDPPLTECPHCGGPLKRVFHPVGIVLKGSGFYSTDNRPGKKTAAKIKEGSGDAGGGSGDSGDKSGTGDSGKADSSAGSGSGSASGSGSGSDSGAAAKTKPESAAPSSPPKKPSTGSKK